MLTVGVQQVTGERKAYLDQGEDVFQVVLDVMLDDGDDDTQLLKEELKHTHTVMAVNAQPQAPVTEHMTSRQTEGSSHFTASVGLLQDPASTPTLTSPFNIHPDQPQSTPILTSPVNTYPDQPSQHSS